MGLKEKLIKAQSRLDLFVDKSQKAGKGSYLKYDYSRESDVLAVLKPLEKELGFGMVISQGNTFNLEPQGNMWVYSSMGTITIFDKDSDLSNSIDNASIVLNIAFIGQNNDPAKAYGSALTYGVKYAFKKVLQLPDDDIDPDNEQGQQKKFEKPKVVFTKDMESVLKEISTDSQLGKDLKEKIKIALDGKPFRPENLVVVQNDTDLMNELMKMLESKEN